MDCAINKMGLTNPASNLIIFNTTFVSQKSDFEDYLSYS